MINPAVFTTTFLAAAVEIIEMVIIVVGVGAIRGWRSTLLGTGAGLAVVAALILALGTALTNVPTNLLRLVAGSLLFVFGLQWLRKGIRRVAANGLRGMGARNAADDDIPAHGVDWIAFLLAFRGVVLEGLEVAIIVATFGAAARAFPTASTGNATDAATTAARSTPKPTIVLEHGAWADGSSWSGVVTRLQKAGYTVDVPPNPLRGLATDSAYLSSYLATISGPVVLAGHSYGGFVTTNAATSDKNIKALVYVDAYIPAKGETINAINTQFPGTQVTPAALNFVPSPGSVTDAYIKPSA